MTLHLHSELEGGTIRLHVDTDDTQVPPTLVAFELTVDPGVSGTIVGTGQWKRPNGQFDTATRSIVLTGEGFFGRQSLTPPNQHPVREFFWSLAWVRS